MKHRSGFTIIELIIAMTVMVILMTLAVVNLRTTQANSRDAKRTSDVATIARGLEQRYDKGLTQPSDGTTVGVVRKFGMGSFESTICQGATTIPGLAGGSYPSVEEISYATGASSTSFCPDHVANFLTDDLPGTASSSFSPPNGGSFKTATSATVPLVLSAGDNNYYYQPLDASGNLCTDSTTNFASPCVKFNLYYMTETKGMQTVRSQHQQ